MARPDIQSSQTDAELSRALSLAFQPLHKRAFGMAVGSAFGLLVLAVTAVHLVRQPAAGTAPDLTLLAQYFYGYTLTWAGAFVGLAWGFVVGFVMGWFVAFSRNFVIAVSLFIGRTRAQLEGTRDFLDHI